MLYKRNGREQRIKSFGGEQIVLTLKMKQEFPDKNYNLYTVCRLKNNEEIPLYDETFTNEQLNKFYNKPSYYIPENNEEVNNENDL